MVAQATPDANGATGGEEPSSAERYVEALTALPGVEHVAVVDVSGQRILAEWGGPEGSADPLLERARAASSGTGRRELEDITSTTASAFHLSRLVLAGPGHPESMWVALRVGRAQGSLPWSRAALAGLDGPTGVPPVPRIPRPREAVRPVSVEPDDGPGATLEGVSAGRPRPVFVPPPPGPAPMTASSPVVPIHRPTAAKVRVVLTPRVAAPTQDGPQDPGAETVLVEVAEVPVTVELALPVPAAPESRPGPVAPEPARRSSFAPVMVVLPPPSPVPDDGTTEEPAPMPAPIIIAPDPADRQVAEDLDETPQPSGVPDDGTEDPDGPKVMRRLIHGLRRRP